MKYILTIFTIISLTSCSLGVYDKNELNLKLQEQAEKSYFEGQKDALNGDVRIKLTSDSLYVWIKSRWNDGSKPIFNPTYLDTK